MSCQVVHCAGAVTSRYIWPIHESTSDVLNSLFGIKIGWRGNQNEENVHPFSGAAFAFVLSGHETQ